MQYHITVNGIPHCEAPVYELHKAARNSVKTMCDSACACGYGDRWTEAQDDAAKLRIALPSVDIRVADGACGEDAWWKTEAGRAAIENENAFHEMQHS